MNNDQQNEMVNLTIDGNPVKVPKGTTVYQAAQKLAIEIPIFCYQDRMPPFGACRMCLVEVENMPKLQTSCTLEVKEGMVVKCDTERSNVGRNRILELLLINHPLDCPVCDKGGECPLQDNTFKWGPARSRFYEDKRDFIKPIHLGPVLALDRERCIVCARCTRFGDIISGDHALEFLDRGYRTEVGTPNEGPAESKYIGNTISICPVGALTSDVYRFKARPWDNESTDTTCTLCPVGCSMILDSRDGEVVRTRSKENRAVNDIWLCDKGWFGYEFADNLDRLIKPLIRKNGILEPSSWDEAFTLIAEKITQAKPSGRLAAFGGNPLTTEECYLFQKLMREGAGVSNVDNRIGMPILSPSEEGLPGGMEMSIKECEELSYAVLLGIDITEEFPLIWLRLKQAINRGAKTLFLGNYSPEIAQHLSEVILHAPGLEIENIHQSTQKIQMLSQFGKGAIFVGRQYLATQNRSSILAELIKLRQSIPNLSLNIMEGRGNSTGARIAGMRPDHGPMDAKLSNPGLNALKVLEQAANSGWSYLHVAGADPATKFSSKLWDKARNGIEFLVVQDMFLTETAKQADVVLPTLNFMEKRGAFINIEGRIQYLQPGKKIPDDVLSDAEIFTTLAQKLNIQFNFDRTFLDYISKERLPLIKTDKLKMPTDSSTIQNGEGLLAVLAPFLFDHGVRMKHNPHLIQLAKEPSVRIHPDEAVKLNIDTGKLVTLKANENAILAKVKLDNSVAPGTIVLPLGFGEIPVQELTNDYLNGFVVEISSK